MHVIRDEEDAVARPYTGVTAEKIADATDPHARAASAENQKDGS
jgi:hypothetical protein